jgi:hypothetical protein
MTTAIPTITTTMTNREIRILADASAIAQTAAAEFIEAAREAVCLNDSFSVALAGGSTPKALYGLPEQRAATAMVPWPTRTLNGLSSHCRTFSRRFQSPSHS